MRLVAPLAACALSCATDAIWWELPADMTPDERAHFVAACARWNGSAIRQQYVARPGDGTHRVQMLTPARMANGPNTRGEYCCGIIRLAHDLEPDQFEMVAMHEQGHALGLEHHDGGGVMAAHADRAFLSEADIAECQRVHACR